VIVKDLPLYKWVGSYGGHGTSRGRPVRWVGGGAGAYQGGRTIASGMEAGKRDPRDIQARDSIVQTDVQIGPIVPAKGTAAAYYVEQSEDFILSRNCLGHLSWGHNYNGGLTPL